MILRVIIAISTISIFIIALILWFDLIMSNFLYLLLLPLIVSLFHLTVSPTFKLLGLYKYLSPLLLVNIPTQSQYELHNGTSFDYLLNFKRFRKYGVKSILLYDYLKGLLKIVEEIEKGNLADTVTVQGSSYFFSKRTANRFGFNVENSTLGDKLNAALNYLDLLWMYSLAHRKLKFPNLRQMKKATIKGSVLVENKGRIELLLSKIEKKLPISTT